MLQQQIKFYSLERIKECDAQYNVIFGMRSNGKTFSVQYEGIKNFIETGKQMAIIRRFDVDMQGKRGQEMFSHIVTNTHRGNIIKELSNGEWEDIYYWSGRWYLCKYDEKGLRIKNPIPFCYGFSLASQEHDKSTSYPNITTIMFDEFLTRGYYGTDEFITFTNVLSTIIRERDDCKIYMLGNTVNKYCPYFKEMGLDNIEKMKQGDLQVYRFAAYNNKELRIAVEYADNPNKNGKASDVYFAFNNPKLKMITNGLWELAIYPHLPMKYERKDIIGEYFIKWEKTILHCEIVNINDIYFTYIHEKTTLIKYSDSDIIFSTEFTPKPNYRRRITKPIDNIGNKILWFYKYDKVFYQNNEVGEVVRNYLNWSRKEVDFV